MFHAALSSVVPSAMAAFFQSSIPVLLSNHTGQIECDNYALLALHVETNL